MRDAMEFQITTVIPNLNSVLFVYVRDVGVRSERQALPPSVVLKLRTDDENCSFVNRLWKMCSVSTGVYRSLSCYVIAHFNTTLLCYKIIPIPYF